MTTMTVGTLHLLEVKPGNEAIMERTFQETFLRVQQDPAITAWSVFRLGPSIFGLFDVFPDEATLQAHLSDEVRARMEKANSLLTRPRTMEKLHVLAAKLPAQGSAGSVTVGFLSRFEAKPGKEAEVEQAFNGTLLAVQQLPATTAWFAFRLGPSTFGTLDLFLNEAGRQTHYDARWPQLQARASQLFVEGSLVIEKIDILLAKLPA